MSKLFASIYDYINTCEISQLDAILVALFCLTCGCGLLVSIFIASAFQPHTEGVRPRLVVQQFASGQTLLVPKGGTMSFPRYEPIAQSAPVASSRPTAINPPLPVVSQYPQPVALPTSVYPAQPTFTPAPASTMASNPFPTGNFSYSYGQPRTQGELYEWYRFGQAAAADRR